MDKIIKVLFINIFFIISFFISYLFKISIVNYLVGPLLLILVSFNFIWIFEVFTKEKLKFPTFLLLSISILPIMLGALSFFIILTYGKIELSIIRYALLVVCLVGSSFLIILAKVRKYYEISWFSEIKKDKLFLYLILSTILYILIHTVIYKYIPGFDGYKYLIEVEKLKNDKQWIPYAVEINSRSLWYAFLIGWEAVTNISPYWLLKIFLPITSSVIIIPFYLIAKDKIKGKLNLLLFSMLPLTFPVIVQEFFYGRPQNVFMIFFISLVWIGYIFFNKPKLLNSYWWWLLMIVFSLVGIKFHQFFIFAIIFSLFGLTFSTWRFVVAKPIESLIGIIFLIVIMEPWIKKFTGGSNIGSLLAPVFIRLNNPTWKWWFLGGYSDIYGNFQQAVNPILYYGYYLGLLLPFLVLVWVFLIKKQRANLTAFNLLLVSFLILFFVIAEILPRLGIYYFPDRFWLWLVIVVMFFEISLILRLSQQNKVLERITMILILVSLTIPIYLTYTKIGAIDKNDFKAVEYMKKNTTDKDVIISDGNNYPIVGYYMKRNLAPVDNYFLKVKNKDEFDQNMNKLMSEYSSLAIKEDSIDLVSKIISQSSSYKIDLETAMIGEKEFNSYRSTISDLKALAHFLETNDYNIELRSKMYPKPRDIYILVRDANGLFGKNTWWRSSDGKSNNFFDDHPELFENVFNHERIKIWKIKATNS